MERSEKHEPETRRQPRKPYATPRLTEYGDVEALTQGSTGGGVDIFSMRA